MSETEDEEVIDIWDDSKLNKAYDKALNIANVEVAKRLAMSTNTQTAKDVPGSKPKKAAPNSAPSKSQKKRQKWRAGMHCRAVYEVDGVEYEAFLMRIFNEKECVVRFIGYENTEIVPLNSLKPSLGKSQRNKQIAEALEENFEECLSSHSQTAEEMDVSDRPQSTGSLASLQRKKSKKSKPKQKNEFILPELPPMPMPNIGQFKNIVSMDMPIPPPPPLGFSNGSNNASEDQAISSMLLSWYMSGYYTGLYQGMKREREQKSSKN
ncbi:survival motor neuron protein isoform X2 [Pararge aegeria]|uniref:survival motor neuron protein isoform X2 n=1 Tax=Pararge aegeria TaxID=116150 RepID=UPI0019D02037|nr:survival motor neuron protein isoform X2 [Pararge aegeria]